MTEAAPDRPSRPAGGSPAGLTENSPWWSRPFRWMAAEEARDGRFRVVATMTLLMLLLHAEPAWYVQAAVALLAGGALLDRRWLRSENLWFLLAGALGVAVIGHRLDVDNHKFLMLYWCIALACSRLTLRPAEALATSARLLVGLAFAFAVLWKVASADFRDGTFFGWTLLQDARFAGVTEVVADVPAEGLRTNRDAIAALDTVAALPDEVALATGDAVPVLAAGITWWTLLIEGAVAVAFLAFGSGILSRARDALLLVFMVTTYALAPVMGFAWVLAAMGVAQVDGRSFRGAAVAYVAVVLLLEASSWVPWYEAFARLPAL